MILLTTLFNPMSWLLEAIHNFVGNWGWSIIILTILINLIVISFRVPLKKNASRLKKMEPSLINIKEKFKDDSHKLVKATNKLYRDEGYKPLFGCIPYLILPLVYFPLYWGIWSSENIISAPWMLWITDLSAPDPCYILPIILGLLSFLDRIRPQSADLSIVKIIIMFVISMASIFLPAGLVLCWVTKKFVYVSYNWIFTSHTSTILPQTNKQTNNTMPINLTKGANVSLSNSVPGLTNILIGLGWDARATDGEDFDLDASAFMLSAAGKVRSDADFIFYHQTVSSDGSVKYLGDNRTGEGEGDDEQITVDLSHVPGDVEKLVIGVTIDEAEARRQNFGMVSQAFVRVVNAGDDSEIVRYDLSEDFSVETAIVFGEVYRHSGEWKFRAVGQGFQGGLEAMAKNFGVNV